MIRHFFVLSLIIAPVLNLSCYAYDNYSKTVRIVHHKSFCTAVFHVAEGAFNGGDRHPSQVATIASMTDGQDCVLKNITNSSGLPSMQVYSCFCFSNMCNYMFTWDEFQQRNFTLKSKYVDNH